MSKKKFYDIHCHTMNLSHPYLMAFVQRFNLQFFLALNTIFGPLVSIFISKRINRIENLLAIMENDICGMYIMLEDYIKSSGLYKDGTICIGGNEYSKIVLTPLLIDFGYKGITKHHIYYDKPARKPVLDQVLDVLNGIREYREMRPDGLFEIYPFLGLNTKNYPLGDETSEKAGKISNTSMLNKICGDKIKYSHSTGCITYFGKMSEEERDLLIAAYPDKKTVYAVSKIFWLSQDVGKRDTISGFLEKYFGEYSGSEEALEAKMGKFDGCIKNLDSNFFAGIKVYPPLGFDPWPEDEIEQKKVDYLYKFCSEKGIPITTHCTDGGYIAVSKEDAIKFSSPERWEKALEKYPGLKLNFAHFGYRKKILRIIPRREWTNTILRLMTKYENVYTDFSYRGTSKDYYGTLKDLVGGLPDGALEKVKDRILFGSDFMINLLEIDSYNHYYDCYSEDASLSEEDKELFNTINPRRFLYR